MPGSPGSRCGAADRWWGPAPGGAELDGEPDGSIALVPRPVAWRRRPGRFSLGPDTAVVLGPGAAGADELVRAPLARATGLTLPVVGPEAPPPAAGRGAITLAVGDGARGLPPEGYRLLVTPAGVDLRARDRAGLVWGIQTVLQLLPPASLGPRPVRGAWWPLPGIEVVDHPRFRWRGCHLDLARHLFPVPFLMAFVEVLALHKCNVFHLHLTDDQGWRLQVLRYPRLTEVGAWRRESQVGPPSAPRFDATPYGGFYTRADLARVVDHAARRGITVVPEIEMPGHAQAAIAAYPRLGNHPERRLQVATAWGGAADVCNVEEETVSFFRGVLDEVLAVFPSPVIHVGGDECRKDQWRASPRAQRRRRALGLADEAQLQAWFLHRMGEFLASRGRRLVGWDEILEGGSVPGATVMCWRGEEAGLRAIGAGHDVVLAPERPTYLDWAQAEGPGERAAPGPGKVNRLDDVLAWEPVPAALDAAGARRILGVQAQLWTEHLPSPEDVCHMAFPRLCALAETGWSPRPDGGDRGFLARLPAHLARLDALGIPYRRPEDPGP